MCIAYGQGYEYVQTGRGFLLASVAISFAWLSHLIVGYGVSVLTVLLPIINLSQWKLGLWRWFKMNLVAGLATAYLNVPTLLEKHILNRSLWEPKAYWDSYGFRNVIPWLFQGKLLDSSWERNYPWLTYIVLISLVALFIQYRRFVTEPNLRFMFVGFLGALALFCGRHTFGPFVNLMPFSYNLPFHRFYVQFHFFAILLAGWVLTEAHQLLTWVLVQGMQRVHRLDTAIAPDRRRHVAAVLAFCIMMAFMVPYGFQYYNETIDHERNLVAQRKDMDEWWGIGTYQFLETIQKEIETRPGRAYAGGAWNWGKHFTLKFIKMFSIFGGRGFAIGNIGMMYHAMGLLGDMDFYYNQSRPDHDDLYNVRYVICQVGTTPNDTKPIGPEHGRHSVHFIPNSSGYFKFIQLYKCYDAWSYPQDDNWHWRESYILGTEHTQGLFHHMPLVRKEACITSLVDLDDHMPRGEITMQQGNIDDFSARVRCDEPQGCTVMLKATPLFSLCWVCVCMWACLHAYVYAREWSFRTYSPIYTPL
jgi:hypothetical protein